MVRLFGRGIRILCFSGGSPVCFFRKLFRVRAFRLFGVRVQSGCALVGYFSGGRHTYIVFHWWVLRPAVRQYFPCAGFFGWSWLSFTVKFILYCACVDCLTIGGWVLWMVHLVVILVLFVVLG